MRAVQSPDSLRQMAADGQAVEDHSYTHPNLAQILPQHVLPEILRTAVVIEATTGIWPHFIRPPGGNTNSLVLATAKACGMSGAFWTIDALPAEETGSPDAVAQWVIRRARPGAIVLMHNGMQATIGAIPKLVQGLRERGYKLVTITQLAADALADRHAKT
jgi:peptidoglycan/xylan/chitin deacetylase (PgdA/CDA1 family)